MPIRADLQSAPWLLLSRHRYRLGPATCGSTGNAADFSCTALPTRDPEIFEESVAASCTGRGSSSHMSPRCRTKATSWSVKWLDRELIFNRDVDGQVKRVLSISCRHRGAAICREPRGTARASSAPITAGPIRVQGELFNQHSTFGYG